MVILKKMLNFLINPDAEFETEEVKHLVQSRKVVYALSTGSSFDLNALIKTAKRNDFSLPKKNKKNFFQLKGAKKTFFHGKSQEEEARENCMNSLETPKVKTK